MIEPAEKSAQKLLLRTSILVELHFFISVHFCQASTNLFMSVFIIFWSIVVASPVRVNLLLWTSPPGLNGSMLMVPNTSPKARAKLYDFREFMEIAG